MLPELSRYLLRAVALRPAEVQLDHIRSGGVEFLFFRLSPPDQARLSQRDKEAIQLVLERVASRLNRPLIVDWK